MGKKKEKSKINSSDKYKDKDKDKNKNKNKKKDKNKDNRNNNNVNNNNNIRYTTKIIRLSNKFFEDYPHEQYEQILEKQERPYSCFSIDTHEGYLICIPFRSRISHDNSYIFDSERTRQVIEQPGTINVKGAGLDYSKVVLITNPDYIDTENVIIADDEYKELRSWTKHIFGDITKYINGYVEYMRKNYKTETEKTTFVRDYRFTTLIYFHDILGL